MIQFTELHHFVRIRVCCYLGIERSIQLGLCLVQGQLQALVLNLYDEKVAKNHSVSGPIARENPSKTFLHACPPSLRAYFLP